MFINIKKGYYKGIYKYKKRDININYKKIPFYQMIDLD